MTKSPPDREAWRRLGELAHQAAAAPVAASQHATGRMRLMMAAASLRKHPARSWIRPLMAAGLGAAAVAAVILAVHLRTRPLTYEVFGGQRFASNYVGAPPSAPAMVMFSDGTEIDARPGSRLRIDETHSNGARVLVERGTAAARVKHGERSRWVFSAGPFDVRVIGTKFDLDWDPVAGTVSLTLHEGAVEVASPVGQSHCVVRAGQRFRASLQDGSMTLENIRDLPRAVSATRNAESSAMGAKRLEGSPEAPQELVAKRKSNGRGDSARAELPKPRAWSSLVRKGDFEAVVEAALAGDLEATLRTCRPAQARALADAARYTDRTALAERVLLSIRERFPGSSHAEAAGFLLGRTHETTGRPEQADRWYRAYLEEAPDGAYTADALAGRMRALIARSDAEAARPIAREYLERFPQGVHLRMARRLAGKR